MLPAELVEVRLVPGVDATVRSLAAVGVVLLSAMAGGLRSLCMRALPVAQAKLHRAWSYSTIPTGERRLIEFRGAGAVAMAARAPPASSGLKSLVRACVRTISCLSLREILVRRQPAGVARGADEGRSVKCTVLRYDKFLYAASWICVRCSLAGRATYVSAETTGNQPVNMLP